MKQNYLYIITTTATTITTFDVVLTDQFLPLLSVTLGPPKVNFWSQLLESLEQKSILYICHYRQY